MTPSRKPGRPFGLSIAILLSVVYFSLLPLMVNGLTLMVLQHFRNVGSTCVPTDGADLLCPFDTGVSGLEVNYWQVLVSVLFLLVAVLAWRGRPPSMRFVLMAAIVGVTVFNLAPIFLQAPPDFARQGIDSSTQMNESIEWVQLASNFLIVLYVLWYINRAPSRAFYRGYYLAEPVGEKQ